MSRSRNKTSLTPQVPLHLRSDSYYFTAEWRWRRAAWRLATASRRQERKDDGWVRRAIRAQRWAQRGRRDKDLPVHVAQQLVFRDPWRAAELQSRVLAGQKICEISHTIRVPEESIEAFEALFFDVRGRLEAQDWIFTRILGPGAAAPWQPNDVFTVWRTLSYQHGHQILDLLLRGVDREDLIHTGLPAYWSNSSRLPLELQMLILANCLPLHVDSLKRLMSTGLWQPVRYYELSPVNGLVKMNGGYDWGETQSKTQFDEPPVTQTAKAA